jgi:hypothetical protein
MRAGNMCRKNECETVEPKIVYSRNTVYAQTSLIGKVSTSPMRHPPIASRSRSSSVNRDSRPSNPIQSRSDTPPPFIRRLQHFLFIHTRTLSLPLLYLCQPVRFSLLHLSPLDSFLLSPFSSGRSYFERFSDLGSYWFL